MNRDIDIELLLERAEENHILQNDGCMTFCPVCETQLKTFWDNNKECISWKNSTQKSHLLSNDKPNNAKYGNIILDDCKNHMLACSLKCNNSVQVRNNKVLEQQIVIDIINSRLFDDPSEKEIRQLYFAWCHVGKLIVEEEIIVDKYYKLCDYFLNYEREME